MAEGTLGAGHGSVHSGYRARPSRKLTAGLVDNWSRSWTSGAGPKSMTCLQLENP